MNAPTISTRARCDRCGAAAQMTAMLPSGSALSFCGHHANQHVVKLIDGGAVLQDQRS